LAKLDVNFLFEALQDQCDKANHGVRPDPVGQSMMDGAQLGLGFEHFKGKHPLSTVLQSVSF
jgi:hypothetical protein